MIQLEPDQCSDRSQDEESGPDATIAGIAEVGKASHGKTPELGGGVGLERSFGQLGFRSRNFFE